MGDNKVSDGRRFNFRGGPSVHHRIRKIVQGNITGDVYGITLPKIIAEPFLGCWMKINVSGNSIILQSGCKIEEQNKFEKDLTKFNKNVGFVR